MSEARWINDFWAQMTAENEDREAKKPERPTDLVAESYSRIQDLPGSFKIEPDGRVYQFAGYRETGPPIWVEIYSPGQKDVKIMADIEARESSKTIAVGDRIIIIGGEHWPREGTVAGFKSVQNLPCASVTLDKALPSGKRVVTVLEAHIDKC